MRTAIVYITDKTGKKYFLEFTGEAFIESSKRTLEKHLREAKLVPSLYEFLDVETAEIKVEINEPAKKLEFTDAQQMAKENPTTFFAPSQQELDQIKVDDIVKVCAIRERFWVIVTKIENDTITGKVDNVLEMSFEHGLSLHDEITFEKKNIYNIY